VVRVSIPVDYNHAQCLLYLLGIECSGYERFSSATAIVSQELGVRPVATQIDRSGLPTERLSLIDDNEGESTLDLLLGDHLNLPKL
jgi:hypothetical protein